ncbi:hypothetical protein BDQ17DRAFT_699876 [Cyathus striatus]|nr:hypothetical protein BDQ17DRAFT_699876 [Cyathus striatus]
MATRHARMDGERQHHYYTTTRHLPGVSASGMHPRANSGTAEHGREAGRDVPWQHMTETYTWVIEQELQRVERRNRKTEQWVLSQQIYVSTDDRRRGIPVMRGEEMWKEMVYGYEREAREWMKEEEARRRAVERERVRERERAIQEEVRKVEERIRHKREDERHRFMEERTRRHAEARERDRKERRREDKVISDAWARYEADWEQVGGGKDELRFEDIPWPTVAAAKKIEDINCKDMEVFFFWGVESSKRKERIRSGQLRWHPDRFRRLLGRVREEDKEAVEERAGLVARFLNEAKTH